MESPPTRKLRKIEMRGRTNSEPKIKAEQVRKTP
jgi:hypothetical protein